MFMFSLSEWKIMLLSYVVLMKFIPIFCVCMISIWGRQSHFSIVENNNNNNNKTDVCELVSLKFVFSQLQLYFTFCFILNDHDLQGDKGMGKPKLFCSWVLGG